jgi:glutamate synthase domain-containing protein 2
MRKIFFISAPIILLLSICWVLYNPKVNFILFVLVPVLMVGYFDAFQKKHTILRNFPVIGHFRYMFEFIRPEIQQYFIESDIDGRPFNKRTRTLIYTRAKLENETVPFGTQLHTHETGYEWINHSMFPKHVTNHDLRTTFGNKDCKQPYNASIFNISAMSFGALSKNAILALNKGAKIGNFAHNTGEGSISPYHLQNKGDLIWQIGTGYFGCRNEDGSFSEKLFEEQAHLPTVKMIELKLSQGAKPGHGGILPAEKNTEEIAKIRKVKPHTDVCSPPYHTAFDGPEGLILFIDKLRKLSGGKPVGFKLCIGDKSEFNAVVKAMKKHNIYPDFITVDGAEGGTGAAPLEFSDYVGVPLYEGLAFVHNTLQIADIRNQIKIIASGKIANGFDIIKAISLGADACNSARGMMFALGCIQALRCNTGKCPTGIATQNKDLMKGLLVEDKAQRVANYHKRTIEAALEMVAAAGFTSIYDVKASDIFRRVRYNKVMNYEEIYKTQDYYYIEN